MGGDEGPLMTIFERVESLVRAHYQRDEEAFKIGTLQVAAQCKSARTQTALRDWTTKTGTLLPLGAKDYVLPLTVANAAELVLDQVVVALLAELAEEYNGRATLLARGIPARTRLLFHGPPGCGKTAAASLLGEAVCSMGYTVSLANLIGEFMGTTGAHLAKLFDALSVGCLLVLDEIDAIGAARAIHHDGAGAESNRIVNTLLTLLDQKPGGVLVATTNRIEMLDPALRRRFDEEVEFPAPTPETAATLIGLLTAKYGLERPPPCNQPGDRASFDAITKAVQRLARRRAMDELRAAKEKHVG